MSMRPALTSAVALVLAAGVSHNTGAAGRFDTKLTPDQQIIQVLNRLTFGPRPGDIDEVRKIGVDKWIALQLHPEQIPENPALEAKLTDVVGLYLNPPKNTGANWLMAAKDRSPMAASCAGPAER